MNVQTSPRALDSIVARANAPAHALPAEAVAAACAPMRRAASAAPRRAERLAQYGPNQLKSAPETPWWKRLLEQFENFLVIILLVAIVISVIEWLLQDPRESALPYEAIVITAIVVLNALLGFFQEARAERSVRALMALAAPESTVVRDGERQRVAAHEIVPGDIVLIEAGDKIPADARIIEDANLHTDEAPLTGESLPVAKSPSRSTPARASATAATCSTPARSRPTAAAAPSSWRPAWKPRSDASPACSRPPRRNRPRCSRSSTAPAAASPS